MVNGEVISTDVYDGFIDSRLLNQIIHVNGVVDELRISTVARQPWEFNLFHQASLSYELPEILPDGEWIISASIGNFSSNTTFNTTASPPPTVNLSRTPSNATLRTDPVNLYAELTNYVDTYDDDSNNGTIFDVIFEYKEPENDTWVTGDYLIGKSYNDSTDRWDITFLPPKTAMLGDYDVRVRFLNTTYGQNGSTSLVITVQNNQPQILLIESNLTSIHRNSTVQIAARSSDAEDQEADLDVELQVEYPRGSSSWTSDFSVLNLTLIDPSYVPGGGNGTGWIWNLTAHSDTATGTYGLRARVTDLDGDDSGWSSLSGGLGIENNPPTVTSVQIFGTPANRSEQPVVLVEGWDLEDELSELTCTLRRSDVGGGGDGIDLPAPTLNLSSGRWELNLDITNWRAGNYTVFARLTDGDGSESDIVSIGLDVLNKKPIALDLWADIDKVNRTQSLFIYANASDDMDIDVLTSTFQYRAPSGNWVTLSGGSYNTSDGYWTVEFIPPNDVELGLYDLRVNFGDDEPRHHLTAMASPSQKNESTIQLVVLEMKC